MNDYYKQKQRDNEEMADCLCWFIAIFGALAFIWACWELIKFLRAAW